MLPGVQKAGIVHRLVICICKSKEEEEDPVGFPSSWSSGGVVRERGTL